MNQIKEAIELVEKAEVRIRPPSSFCKDAHEFLIQAIAKLSTEQPLAGEFTIDCTKKYIYHWNGCRWDEPCGRAFKEACARLDRSEASRKELLTALERDDLLANQAILATPTGDLRNKLTELNILRIAAIAKAKKEVKI